METCLSVSGILLVMVGSWFVAYEVVNKFQGQTHTVSVAFGGPGTPKKLPEYVAYELRRNKFMWFGLALITLGSLSQAAGALMSA
jgi:hypothetical protein